MKLKMIVSASLLALCGFASAQSVVEITDPAKIAEIERHAQQLGAQPMASDQNMRMDMRHDGDRMYHRGERMHRKHMRAERMHRKMRHQQRMHGTRSQMKPPAEAAMPTPMPAN